MSPKPVQETRGGSASRAAYQAKRRAYAITFYFRSTDEMEAYQEAAEASGYGHNFNAYLLQLLATASSGSVFPPDYVEGLKSELARTRAWLETSKDENHAYRAEVKTLQQQKETLLLLLHDLPEGAAVAQRFLEQTTARAGMRS